MTRFGRITFFLLISTLAIHGHKNYDVDTVYEWNLLEYGFPTARDQQQAIANGHLVVANGVPIDVAPYYSNDRSKMFVTIPRFQTGIPYSLAVVTNQNGLNGPILKAYPRYNWHNSHGTNCDGITSAFRVAITECNQMWVIDSGVIGSYQHCPPQLLLFDLQTDQLIHRHRFDSSLYTTGVSLFITPVVVVNDKPPHGRCQQAMVYIADVTNHGLVIYDFQKNLAWRAENKFMYPNPEFGTHSIAGEEFNLMDGIFGMAADKHNLYFHPLASNSEFSIPLSLLNNQSNWLETAGTEDAMLQMEFKHLGRRGSECAAQAIDNRGNIYCVTFKPIKLFSWNVESAYKLNNFREISSNEQILQFVSGMKVVNNGAGQELWMLSNRFQKIAAGTQNANEINFRILKRRIDQVINGIGNNRPINDLHNHLIFN